MLAGPTPYSPSRCRLWGSPTEGSGSRSKGSSEVQALACLPSPSHRKSSNLAETSPGAAPGACCGEKCRAHFLSPQLDQQPCSPGVCPILYTTRLYPSTLILIAYPVPRPYTPLQPSTQYPHYPPTQHCHFIYSKLHTPKLHPELHIHTLPSTPPPAPLILSTFRFPIPYSTGHSFSLSTASYHWGTLLVSFPAISHLERFCPILAVLTRN